METLQVQAHSLSLPSVAQFQSDTDKIKRNLIQKGVFPTPKIVHNLRKKQIQKHNRKLKQANQPPPLTESQRQELSEEQHFQALKREYREFKKEIEGKASGNEGEALLMAGKPWEGLQKVEFLERMRGNKKYRGEKLKRESLMELKEMFQARKMDELKWVFDDDIEVNEHWFNESLGVRNTERKRSEAEVIRFLVDRLSDREITTRDWKLSRIMKLSGLPFMEGQLLRIVEMLGVKGCWKQALSVVQWVYNYKDHRKYQSRFVYTKLLAVLGKARKPKEALQIFNLMRGNVDVYPDMAAYHSIAVTLGQAGLLKELLNIVECMRQKPKTVKFMYRRNWDPILEPDVVIYNAVLNACVPSKQWKGVSWVFKQLRKNGLKPNGATFGLAMEVMLQSGNYDLVHELFGKMRRSGEVPKAVTYKVLVRTFWMEGKVDEAVEAVREMERRGVMGTASVYYELACCLCNYGRWQDAILEVEKIKRLPHSRPLEVTFTGMIKSSMDGGYFDDCICIFECMKKHCAPNIGTINTMLKVYGQNDMFSKAKELFEEVKVAKSDFYAPQEGGSSSVVPDVYTYHIMLESSASAHQWEYFEHWYREMILSGYQLDQNKHLSVLVEASRAGKSHLLEHVFDMILEAGEIPHHILFFELVIQAIAQHNYERAVILVDTMAYAPFRVTEKQWTVLFKENEDRISHENLEQLLDALGNCDVVSEPTVSNLSRSLHVLCGLGASRNISSIIPFGSENTINGQNEGIDDGGIENVPNISGRMMMGSAESGNDILFGSYRAEPDTFTFNLDQADGGDDNDVMVCRPPNCNIEDRMSLCDDDLTPDKSSDSLVEELCDDGSSEDDVGHGVIDKPSAYEILDLWKEMRKEGSELVTL
ncbi:pentatricopeptide repeat-containing protein At5g67570, chloroplastic [Gastrolobium bilobum]|uniref:pentatricopeptide repeat-containing protein At5g67570, chloroplastic n=1 Tax=Gastrolobium bilobum TaxID=150636 RepID=UPI002AB0C703|nr:pentatricopeptide repeat-containing protein At5g67570, chloroplastic [Gastrolobium bilobum]